MGLDMYGGKIRKEETSCEGQVFFQWRCHPNLRAAQCPDGVL